MLSFDGWHGGQLLGSVYDNTHNTYTYIDI